MLPEKTQVLIVGAGIVGLTVARELVACNYRDILILEKEPAPGRHASGRNSGVLHAGIYYSPDTLKARMCLRGNRLMRAYCRDKGLPILNGGKVIVTRSEAEIAALEALYRRARANGARVEIVDAARLRTIEPAARTVEVALYSHDTAQVAPKAVLDRMAADLTSSGRVRIVSNCAFRSLAGSTVALTTGGRVGFDRLVNAAGAHCDHVANAFGLARNYRLIPFKGIYRKLKRNAPVAVRGNIYPVPDIRNPFLGVHFTRSVQGGVYIGPTAIPALGRENYGILKGIDREGWSILLRDGVLFAANPKFRRVALNEPRKYVFPFFFRDACRLVRGLEPSHVEASAKVGIRAQLVDWDTKEMVMDFLVQADDRAVHILNPVSPAFTCSMELARRVVADHF